MKKFKTYLSIFAMLICTITFFTSCDEDFSINMSLSGEWEGTLRVSDVDFGSDTYNCIMAFKPNSGLSSKGSGYQIIYYYNGYSRKQYVYDFYYTVRNGDIIIDFDDPSRRNVTIFDYKLNGNYFDGYYGDKYSESHFKLYKVYDYNHSYYDARKMMESDKTITEDDTLK